VCCSVLQFVSVLRNCYVTLRKKTATCFNVLVCYSVLECVGVCCSVLQCVAVCCSVLQCVAVCCSKLVYCGINTWR